MPVRRSGFAVSLVIGLAVLATAAAPEAAAHAGALPDAPYYRSSVTSVTPEITGLGIQLERSGESITLTNRTGQQVEVPGYAGEPYLRFTGSGVEQNIRSMTAFLNGSLVIQGLPQQQAAASSPPEWKAVSSSPSYTWHDHRIHWMAQQRPPVVAADPAHPHEVLRWTIPLTVGGTAVSVQGVLTWTGEPGTSPLRWAYYALSATTLAALIVLLIRHQRLSARTRRTPRAPVLPPPGPQPGAAPDQVSADVS